MDLFWGILQVQCDWLVFSSLALGKKNIAPGSYGVVNRLAQQ